MEHQLRHNHLLDQNDVQIVAGSLSIIVSDGVGIISYGVHTDNQRSFLHFSLDSSFAHFLCLVKLLIKVTFLL